MMTGVYGPTMHRLKEAFLRHIRRLKPNVGEGWLLFGDFNMIYRARDKNNININLGYLACVRHFRLALDHCELQDIQLQNRKIT